MADLDLVDVSLRDGNQSLWGATGLRTAHIGQIAPVMNRVGFRALDYSSSTAMGVSVRTHRENPWDLLRLTRQAMPETARIIKAAGGHEVIAALTYTVSAAHDDTFYAGIAGEIAACAHIDRAYIKDPA